MNAVSRVRLLTAAIAMACGNAMAADYSASITPEGINLYSIDNKGVELVKGSPYVLPQPGLPYPLTPQLLAISPRHDFLFVVYEQVPFKGDLTDDTAIVGLKITPNGLIKQWSYGINIDPLGYRFVSLTVALNSVTVYFRPNGLGLYVLNDAGQLIAGTFSRGPGNPQVTSALVAPHDNLFYSCWLTGDGVKYAEVDTLVPLQNLLLTSYDPAFIQSVCN